MTKVKVQQVTSCGSNSHKSISMKTLDFPVNGRNSVSPKKSINKWCFFRIVCIPCPGFRNLHSRLKSRCGKLASIQNKETRQIRIWSCQSMRIGRTFTCHSQICSTQEFISGHGTSSYLLASPDLDLASQCEFRQPGLLNSNSSPTWKNLNAANRLANSRKFQKIADRWQSSITGSRTKIRGSIIISSQPQEVNHTIWNNWYCRQFLLWMQEPSSGLQMTLASLYKLFEDRPRSLY